MRTSTMASRVAGAVILGLLILRAPVLSQDRPESYVWLEPAWLLQDPAPPEPQDPLGQPELHPRVLQVAGGVAGWSAGALSTALLLGLSSLCVLSDDPNSDACDGPRRATIVAAGAMSAMMVEGLGRDRRERSAFTKVFVGSAAGLGLATLAGWTSGDDGTMDFNLPALLTLQVGGALLGDYWASRTEE